MNHTTRFHPPYYGAAYYPEDWPIEQMDEDIRLMREVGMNCMRLAEFAWARMEPEEGRYNFDWLHTAIQKLIDADIAVILCTPSATPPAWLTSKYPETLFVNPDGKCLTHGGRRHTCPNSPVYRAHCARIVTRMAEEFSPYDATLHGGGVVGWQIDNEVAPHYDFGSSTGFFSRSCCCPICREMFSAYLSERYGTVEVLNEAWCLDLWSQKYSDFDQIPTPDAAMWHHPSLLMAWDEFSSRSWVDFVAFQADILREKTAVPIGTDMMPFHEVDHYAMNEHLDVVQYNHYDFGPGLRNAACWFDFLRPVKERPFWNTETALSYGGNTAVGCGAAAPGFCRANSWMPIALGAEANMFWLWRTHWAGQEIMFGAVISSQGRPTTMFNEAKETAEGLQKVSDFIMGTKPTCTGLALHFSHYAHVLFKSQPMLYGFNYTNEFLQRNYHPLIRAQWRPDVLDASADLSPYRLIVSCFTPTLDVKGLRDRLEKWILDGGTWIAGPFTDIRNYDGAKFIRSPFGSLENWGGVYAKYELPGGSRTFRFRAQGGKEEEGALWYTAFETPDAKTLYTYTHDEFKGLAAVTQRHMGKGKVIVLGTMPPEHVFLDIVAQAADDAGVQPVVKATSNLLVVPRTGEAGEGIIAVEMDNAPASCYLPHTGVNLLTGEQVTGELNLPPYGVAVIQYTDESA